MQEILEAQRSTGVAVIPRVAKSRDRSIIRDECLLTIDPSLVGSSADRFGIPTHAARQSWRGIWYSKIGSNVDITHKSPQALEGPAYGVVVQMMKRPWTVRRLAAAAVVRIRTCRWLNHRCLWRDSKSHFGPLVPVLCSCFDQSFSLLARRS